MIRTVRTEQDFHAMRGDWNRLAENHSSPLLKHEFFSACVAMRGPDAALMIHALIEDGETIAIAPLERVAQNGVSRLHSLGREIHEPFGFLFKDSAALAKLIVAIRASRYPLLLNRLEADGAEEGAMRRLKRAGDFLIGSDGGSTPHLCLAEGVAGFEQGLSKARKADIRRKHRLAERLGPVSLRVAVPCPGDVDSELGRFFRLEESGWKGRSGSAILSSPARERFFRAYGTLLAAEGRLRIFFLSIGNSLAAARMAICDKNHLWELKIAYDEALRHCSPGMILTYESIRYACEQRLGSFHFLGRVAPWNDFWGIEIRRHATIRYYPLGLRSLVGLGSDALALGGRSALRALGGRRDP